MNLTLAEIQRVRHCQDQFGLNVSSIGSPIGKVKLVDVDDGTKNRYVPFKKYLAREVKKACDLAHAFEAKLIRGFSFYHPKGSDVREHLGQAVDQLGQIAEACHRADLTYGLEVEANLVGANGDVLAEIYRQVNHPGMVLVFDAANILVQGYSSAEVYQQYLAMKPGLGWLHVKDYRCPPHDEKGGHVDEEALAQFVPADVGDGAPRGHSPRFRPHPARCGTQAPPPRHPGSLPRSRTAFEGRRPVRRFQRPGWHGRRRTQPLPSARLRGHRLPPPRLRRHRSRPRLLICIMGRNPAKPDVQEARGTPKPGEAIVGPMAVRPGMASRTIASSRWATLWAAGLIALATFTVYSNTFRNPFIFDDGPCISGNPTIRSLWPIGRVLSPPAGTAVQRRPIVNLSLAINYAISGDEVWSYHALNLLGHLLAALLLFGIVRRTLLSASLQERWRRAALPLAFTVALLWAVHPLLTEAVTYVVQRTEVLAGLFYLLTLYCLIRGAGSNPKTGTGTATDGGSDQRRYNLLRSQSPFSSARPAAGRGMPARWPRARWPWGARRRRSLRRWSCFCMTGCFLSPSWRAVFRRRWALYVGLASTWAVILVMLPRGYEGTRVFAVPQDAEAVRMIGEIKLPHDRLHVGPIRRDCPLSMAVLLAASAGRRLRSLHGADGLADCSLCAIDWRPAGGSAGGLSLSALAGFPGRLVLCHLVRRVPAWCPCFSKSPPRSGCICPWRRWRPSSSSAAILPVGDSSLAASFRRGPRRSRASA